MAEESTTQVPANEVVAWENPTGDFFGVKNSAVLQEVVTDLPPTTEKVETVPQTESTELGDLLGDDLEWGFELEPKDLTKTTETTKTKESEEEEESETSTDDEEKGDKTKITATPNLYRDLALDLKDKGLFSSIEIDEEKELSPEEFLELQQTEIKSQIDEGFKEFFTGLDDDGINFLKFKKEGGDTKAFLQTYAKHSSKPSEEVDLETEEGQLAWGRYYLENFTEQDTVEVTDFLIYQKENGKLGAYAKKAKQKAEEIETKQKAALVETQKAARLNAEKKRKEYVTTINTTVSKLENAVDFPLNDKLKAKVAKAILNPSEKLNGRNVTQVQAGIASAYAEGNEEKLAALTVFILNDFKIPEGVKKKVQTEKTKEAKLRITGNAAPISSNNASGNGKQTLSLDQYI